MSLHKSKPEDRTLPAWLDALVGPLYLDFVAPMSLEEALRQLKTEEKQGFFRYRKIHVDLIPYDADTFGFTVKKSGGKYATTEANGILKRWGKNMTQVTGSVNVAMYYYVILPIIVVSMLIFIAILPSSMLWFAGWFLLIMAFNWYMMRNNRYEVVRLIETALEAQPDDSPIRW